MPLLPSNYNKKLLSKVDQIIKTYNMFQAGDAVLIGVSGGPDSVALLHVLISLAPHLSLSGLGIAHLNHSLREKECDYDAEFVNSLAIDLDLPCYISKEDIRKHQKKYKLSVEETARRIRYKFFESIAEEKNFDKIAIGHHANDNAELVLMYLLRGSGNLGLSGIPPVRGKKIVRPLIRLMRSEIIDFLNLNGINYINDKSNEDTIYLRNKLRHHLIPLLESSYNPRIVETINRLAGIIRVEEEWIQEIVDPVYNDSLLFLDKSNNIIVLSAPKIRGIKRALQRRVLRRSIEEIRGSLRRISFSHIENIIEILNSRKDYLNLDLPDRLRVTVKNDSLVFSIEKKELRKLKSVKSAQNITFEYKILFPDGTFEADKPFDTIYIRELGIYISFSIINFKNMPDINRAGHRVAFFDMDKLVFPLILRNYQEGDRFKPLGMQGTQKLKKYFINQKVSRDERARCPLLLSKKRIIWVVGHRISDSVKIGPETRNVLKAELLLA